MNIIWKKPDGSLAITILTPEAISPEAEAAKLQSRGDIPADYEILGYAQTLPSDRQFRDAWVHTVDGIIEDLDQSKELLKEQLRIARKPKLEALDIDYQRADESGDVEKKAEIVASKQALRDIPEDPAISGAQSIAELKAFKPAVLE